MALLFTGDTISMSLFDFLRGGGGESPKKLKSLTLEDAERQLEEFKAKYPTWAQRINKKPRHDHDLPNNRTTRNGKDNRR
jgi:hypothetical protein